MASATLIGREEERVTLDSPPRGSDYRCDCGHVLRVFGGGRHRVYFERGGTLLDDPVMDRVCPECGGALPGKG